MKVNCYKLEEVNAAIDDLRHGRLTGSAVIVVDESLLLCVCFQCSFLFFTSSFPLHTLPNTAHIPNHPLLHFKSTSHSIRETYTHNSHSLSLKDTHLTNKHPASIKTLTSCSTYSTYSTCTDTSNEKGKSESPARTARRGTTRSE